MLARKAEQVEKERKEAKANEVPDVNAYVTDDS
jgi:hypothetical protein